MTAEIHLVMLTYNRLNYTRLSLPRLLQDPAEEFSLTIWDNGSTDGTRDYLRTVHDSRIVDIFFCDENKGQRYVTNEIWQASSASLVGKVDNDCLVTPGWTRILSQAHRDLSNLGVVGCWHFFPDDFDLERARHKIQSFGRHRIFRHPWIDGSALLVKRAVYEKFAPCGDTEYLSGFWLRLARAGYVNGFYYPLIYQEHMDDPKSRYTRLKDEANYQEARKETYGLKLHKLDTLDERWRFREKVLRNLLDDPWDPKYYTGWRRCLQRMRIRLKKVLPQS